MSAKGLLEQTFIFGNLGQTLLVHGRISTVELRRPAGEFFPEELVSGVEAFLLVDDPTDVRLQVGDGVWPVEGTLTSHADALRQIATHDLPRLVWVVQRSPAKGRVQ